MEATNEIIPNILIKEVEHLKFEVIIVYIINVHIYIYTAMHHIILYIYMCCSPISP